ncbi:hypothetical protein ACEZCY_17445 [Streptacidiphilus sp. N1-12]|uniref:Uncharacterized protein n=2 Tax=Streptacidiphilus alkalitolerans TaxID=3342712 RepID=A0ABV6WG52_9ACTN
MLRRLLALGRSVWNLLAVAMTVAGVGFALRLHYAPLRFGVIAVIAVGVAASVLVGRVAEQWPARLLRAVGYGMVLAEGLFLAHSFDSATGNDQLHEKTVHGVPLFGAVLVCCTVALAAATSRRAAVGGRALIVGGGVAVVTGAAVLTPVLLAPPLPRTPGWALLALFAGGFAAFLISVKWLDQPRQFGVAVLCAVVLTGLLLATTVEGLLQFSAHWVPDTSPANVAAADRLENNRLGAEDPYLWILGLAFFAALPLAGLTLRLGGRWWRSRPAEAGGTSTGLGPVVG